MSKLVSVSPVRSSDRLSLPRFDRYRLIWRQHQLLVRCGPAQSSFVFPPLQHARSLSDCLKRSPIRLVKLDLALGEDQLKFWLDACHRAEKRAYIRIHTVQELPRRRSPVCWRIKRSLDWLGALLLLLLLSPALIAIAIGIRLTSPGPIVYRQWRVGERGRLFQILKFRTMIDHAEALHHEVMGNQEGLHKLQADPRTTSIGHVLRRYSLDELPQLINVLRGEMSLVGPRPWALYDAVRVDPALQCRFNALPGITGEWQVESRSHELDLNIVNRNDLRYLASWSLWKDFKFLLLTVPKVLTGFGAY